MSVYVEREALLKELETAYPNKVFFSREDAIECVEAASAEEIDLEQLKMLKELRSFKKPLAFRRVKHDFAMRECPYTHVTCDHMERYSHEYEYVDYKCPSCNKRVSEGTPEYCCHCGQALEWK